ncbi:MAG: helix-turn-helix transcriptional regulator [Eubacteriales bacterium]|nr:helix-turn-helix transcriptional regulator [Eubacteriales bacterium]
MGIGSQIKKHRMQSGLTQAQLAEKLGVATITIRQYESEKREPRLEQQQKIAAALNIPVTELLASSEIETYETGADFDKARNKVTEDIKKADAAESERLERLTTNFRKLNAHGQEEAVKRTAEMTNIPEFTEGRRLDAAIAHDIEKTTIEDRVTGEKITIKKDND